MIRTLCTKAMTVCLLVTISLQPCWSAPQVIVPTSGDPNRPSTRLPGQSVTLLPNGRWLLSGGQGKNGSISTVAVWNPLTNATTTLNAGLLFPRAFRSATLLPDG